MVIDHHAGTNSPGLPRLSRLWLAAAAWIVTDSRIAAHARAARVHLPFALTKSLDLRINVFPASLGQRIEHSIAGSDLSQCRGGDVLKQPMP